MVESRRPHAASLRHQGEALWWMIRPFNQGHPAMQASLGWLAADPSPDYIRLSCFVVFACLCRGVANIANDLLDREADRVTAPFYPLPSGVISARGAVTGAIGLAALAALTLSVASPNLYLMVLATLLVLGGLGMFVLYSLTKAMGFIGTVFATLAGLALPVAGWLLAAHEDRSSWGRLLLVVVFMLLWYFSGNILQSLKDIEGDAECGTRTVAVRLGERRAFTLAAVVGLISFLPVVAIAIEQSPRGLLALPILGASLAIGLRMIFDQKVAPSQESTWYTRKHNVSRYSGPVLWWALIAAVISLAPLYGAVLGAAATAQFGPCDRAYRRRVVDGGMARSAFGADA